MQRPKSVTDAWALLRSDLQTHPSGPEVYLRVGPSESGPLDNLGLTPAEANRFEHVTVGLPGGVELGGGIDRSDTAEGALRALAALAECVQDVIEESSHEAWPRCPLHGRSASVQVHGTEVRWSCSSGDWAVPVGELASHAPEAPPPDHTT